MANEYGMDSRVLDYLMQKRKPEVEPLPTSDNQLIASMADASAKLGTIGGQTADTSSVQKFADVQDARAMQDRQRQMAAREGEDQRQLAIASLLDKYKMQQDARMAGAQQRQADRDFKLAMQDRKRAQDLSDRERDLQDKMTLERSRAANKLALAQAEREAKPKQLGKAQEAVDKSFAKEYSDFVLKGKESAAQSINMLEGYVDQLEAQQDDLFQAGGGAFAAMLPDAMRSAESIKLRDDITGIAMQGLKDVFGGAISDGERKALAATFYNDKLPPNENIPILKRKLQTLKDTYANKLAMAQHYENAGTLEGFRGISQGDMLSNLKEKDPVRRDTGMPVQSGTAIAAPKSAAPKTPMKKQWNVGDEATNPNTGKVMVKGADGLWYEKE
jgi:hypothetical protein